MATRGDDDGDSGTAGRRRGSGMAAPRCQRAWLWIPLGMVLLPLGCSRDDSRLAVFPVSGRVEFEIQAASGAFLVFHPVGKDGPEVVRPSALVKPDGSFTATTYEAGDGAPEGEYAVTVEWRKLIVNGGDAEAGPNVVPARYGRPETSPIKVTVAATPNTLSPFQITKK